MAKREFPLERTRNIGIMAHIDAGKTTTTERILYYTGKTYKIGEVHEGAAIMDHMVAGAGARHHHHVGRHDRASGTTTASTSSTRPATSTSPIEVERSLRVLDGAVAVFDSVAGVEPQTETVWRQANKYACRACASSTRWTASAPTSSAPSTMIKDRLEATPGRHPAPDRRRGPSYTPASIDLVKMKALVWTDEELGAQVGRGRHPGRLRGQAERVARQAARHRRHRATTSSWRSTSATRSSPRPRSRRAIRKGTLGVRLRAGAVRLGVQEQGRAADARRRRRLPAAPARHPAGARASTSRATRSLERQADEKAPFAALAFKIVADPFGKLTYFRVYSGSVDKGGEVYNSHQGAQASASAASC